MRTLIFGASFIADEERAWLTRQWCHVTASLNPDCHILAINTRHADFAFPDHPRVEVIEFSSNIGHLPGFARSFALGLSMGWIGGYERIAHVECDLLFMHPVAAMFDLMTTPAAAPIAKPYKAPECGLMFFQPPSAEWLMRAAAPAVNWWEAKPLWASESADLPETKLLRCLGKDLTTYDLRGARCEGDGKIFPEEAYRLDWLTHATRPHYEVMMRAHGLEPVA